MKTKTYTFYLEVLLMVMCICSLITFIYKTKQEVYVICDVVETEESGDTTLLTCEMPNGELHAYEIEDAPEEIELVCFKTNDQDDYSVYEIVGAR